MSAKELRFVATPESGEVSALLLRPRRAHALLALAHGAGAGMRHAFLEALAEALASRGVASFRYHFPYMERGRRAPDGRRVLLASVRAAVATAAELADGLPLFAGGKSMGGRMTSLAAAEAPLPDVRGIVFLGFPLHAAGRSGSERAEHLRRLALPLLLLQGTRDRLAPLPELEPLCRRLPGATLHVVEGADHGFHVPKRSGRSDADAIDEIAETVSGWLGRH